MKLLLVPGIALLYSAMFQMPPKPPMKMGLWESESQVHMNIPNAPAMMAGMMNKTVRTRSCVTPESYAKNFGATQQKDCHRTNEVWAEKHYSFDMTCNSGKAIGHFEMTFENENTGHGTVHLNMSQGRASGATSDSTISTKWLGADCGSVTPDKPEIM